MDISLSQGNGHVHPYQEIYPALTSFRMQKAWEAWVYYPHRKTKLPFLLTRWHGLARTLTQFLEIHNWLLRQRTAECNHSKSVWRSQPHPEDQKAPFTLNAIHRYGTEDTLGSGTCPSTWICARSFFKVTLEAPHAEMIMSMAEQPPKHPAGLRQDWKCWRINTDQRPQAKRESI